MVTGVHFDKGLERYILKVARRDFWRVASWYEIDDVIQDGYLVACKCEARYRNFEKPLGSEQDRRQFMAFFMRAFHNHICDLAEHRRYGTEVTYSTLADEELIKAQPTEQETSTMSAMISNAPSEIKSLISAVLNGVDESYRKTRLRSRQTPKGNTRFYLDKTARRETTEEKIGRVTGVKGATQLIRDFALGC